MADRHHEPSALQRTADLLDRCISTDRRLWWTIVLLMLAVFLRTAHWTYLEVNDATAAAWPAWALVHHGTIRLEGVTGLPDIAWFQEVNGHLVSDRMPGVILIGVPAQFVLAWTDVRPIIPAVLTAAVVSALAVGTVAVVLRRAGVSRRFAMTGALVLALGTGLWTTASTELLTHGPDALWLSLFMLALTRHRYLLAGAAIAPALLTRPHLALVAATVGLWLGWRERSPRPLISIGVPSVAAVGLLVAWNAWVFGSANLDGGYGGRLASATSTDVSTAHHFAVTLAGSLVSPSRGLLLYSPVVLVAIVALYRGWRQVPHWARACLMGGVLYQAAQTRVNGFSGGYSFYSNRLVVEMLVLATPAACLAYVHVAQRSPGFRRVARTLAATSIALHMVGALLYVSDATYGTDLPLWTTWVPWEAATSGGGATLLISVVLSLVVLAVCQIQLPAGRDDHDLEMAVDDDGHGQGRLPRQAAPDGREAHVSVGAP